MAQPTLAVVGATGSVGTVMLELLSSRRNVWGEIRLLASARSAGKSLICRGERLDVRELTADSFDGVDVAMFDVPDAVSEHWAPIAVSRGTVVVDNSSAFRMRPDVPLVVPEVNREDAAYRPIGIVSSANCTVAAMIIAVAPLHHEYGLRELVLASYQSASGAGQYGIDTLHDQLTKVAGDRLLGSRPGNVRQAVGDDLGPFPAPLGSTWCPGPGIRRTTGGPPRSSSSATSRARSWACRPSKSPPPVYGYRSSTDTRWPCTRSSPPR
jgi:aspartate-semialdehyde dehydrogenase